MALPLKRESERKREREERRGQQGQTGQHIQNWEESAQSIWGATYDSVKLASRSKSKRKKAGKSTRARSLKASGPTRSLDFIGRQWEPLKDFKQGKCYKQICVLERFLWQRSRECLRGKDWKWRDHLRGWCNNPELTTVREETDRMLTQHYSKGCPWASANFWTNVSLPLIRYEIRNLSRSSRK